MKTNILGEVLISIFLIILLSLFLNPMELSMPRSFHMLIRPLLIAVFVVFTALVWKETAGDEREKLHKFIAARFAYFAAVATLIIGIILQSFQKTIDPWLVIALSTMLLAKIFGLIYGYFRH